MDEELGFCHVRVPTWLPCRLQICLNGHNWLARRLSKLGIEYRMADNAFTHIADWQKAQTISDGRKAKRIHERLNELARLCCLREAIEAFFLRPNEHAKPFRSRKREVKGSQLRNTLITST